VMGSAACVPLSYVSDIRVGTTSLNVGSQPVPCECFAKDAVGTTINAAVWAGPAVQPVVNVLNGTGGTITYSGGFFGPVSLTPPPQG
jgi:hypothetical protein